jgi:hypothetical protein
MDGGARGERILSQKMRWERENRRTSLVDVHMDWRKKLAFKME